jgi:hypothetical protein
VTDPRARAPPPRRAADLRPVIATIRTGARWVRFVKAGHPDALGAGVAPSRFSDPILARGRSPRWLPIYLGRSFTLCLQETVLRDRANAVVPGPFLISRMELAVWDWAEIEITQDLHVTDLRLPVPVCQQMSSAPQTSASLASGQRLFIAIPNGLTA